mgnify:CR=1 FL=1
MAYEKQIWKDLPDETTPITKDRLEHMEDGIYENDINTNSLLEALGLKDDTYDATKTYAVGDMVIKNHTIYECTTAITTAEVWNSAHWKIVPIITN